MAREAPDILRGRSFRGGRKRQHRQGSYTRRLWTRQRESQRESAKMGDSVDSEGETTSVPTGELQSKYISYGIVKKARYYVFAAAAIALALAVLYRFEPHVNVAAAGLLLVTVVTICSVLWGSGPGLLAALIGVTGLNYYFIPPVHTFSISGT